MKINRLPTVFGEASKKIVLIFILLACGTVVPDCPAGELVNSIGVKLVKIEAGDFLMGDDGGDWDEKPVHKVTLSTPFFIGAREITNAQYEKFDPEHKSLRGRSGKSKGDDDPVVLVSWNDAVSFCRWLSEKEGKPYRLPTEAEWEYACRTNPKLFPSKVENWCLDWYGPYPTAAKKDPMGCRTGDLRVTRGGTWRAKAGQASSSNRLADLPADRIPVLGFRVVQAPMPEGEYVDKRPTPRWARGVKREKHDWKPPVDMSRPYFAEPITFVKIPTGMKGPLYSNHNHCPGITYCENGDLLAVWYSTIRERGRELAIAGSRLRLGCSEWDEADLFWDVPDRNDHAPTIWQNGKGRLYHFNGWAIDTGWAKLALLCRTSTDDGMTWSPPQVIHPEHGLRHMPISSTFKAEKGAIYLPCDAVTGGHGGSVLHVSRDNGDTWKDLSEGADKPKFVKGNKGGWIAGIHTAVDEWSDGRIVAFGRGDAINGRMPMSISEDGGKTWTYHETEFPIIRGGQRPVLRRLPEGCFMFISFTTGMDFKAADGSTFWGKGMFAALSYDGGKTWPVKKLMTDGKTRRQDGGAWTGGFAMSATRAEPRGYLAAVQTPDRMIHLISSAIHYRFNLAWLKRGNVPPSVRERGQDEISLERSDIKVSGRGCELGVLKNGGKAYSNRTYTWHDVPDKFAGWQFTRTAGGGQLTIKVTAEERTTLFAATATKQGGITMDGWSSTGMSFCYSDGGRTRMEVFSKNVKKGESVSVPQGNWSGAILLIPPKEKMEKP